MANTAEGIAEVRINDQQAQNALKELADRSARLNNELNEMRKSNDKTGFDKTKKELDAVNKEMKQYTKTVFDVKKVLDNLSGTSYNNLLKAQRELRKEIRGMNRDSAEEIALYKQKAASLGKVDQELTKVQKDMRYAGNETSKFGQIAKQIGPWLMATFSIGALTGFVSSIIRVRQEFEKYEAVLTNTLGSKSAAQESLKMIQDFASKTPFQVTELTGAFVKLANMGFKPTREEMRKMGDLASSTGKGFDQLAEAIIDAQTGQFERLKEFGVRGQKEGDKVMFTFKGVKQEVDFTTDSIKNYITSLGDMQGVSGSMAAISATLGGKISNMGDAWDSLLNTMGKMTGGILTAVIGGITDLVGWTQKLIEIPASETLEKERGEVNLLFNSITSLNEGNEARAGLLTELQSKYPEYFANQDIEKMNNADLLKLQTEINDQFLKRIQLAVYEEELTAIAERAKEIKKQERDAIKDINRIYEQYIENKQEGLTVEQKAQAILEANLKASGATATMYGEIENSAAGVKGEIKNYMAEITASQKEQNELSKEYTDILTEQQALIGSGGSPGGKGGGKGGKNEPKSVVAKMFIPTDEEFEEFETALDAFNEAVAEAIAQGVSPDEASMMQTIVDQVLLETTELHKKQTADFEKKKKEELAIEKETQRQKLAFIADYVGNAAALFKEDTIAFRVLASAQAVVNTWLAVTAILAEEAKFGPIAQAFAVAATIATGLSAVTKINAVQFADGKYDVMGASDGRSYRAGYASRARTGIYGSPTLIGGLGLVGEQAPELVVDGPTTRNIQMNAPGLIQAIQQMRVPQYAAGNYQTASKGSAAKASQMPGMDTNQINMLASVINALNEQLARGINSKILYADIDNAINEVENIKKSVSK